jgi:hypothetical protein
MDLAHVLSFKYPGYKAVIIDNNYDSMVWMPDNEIEKPSLEDIKNAAVEYEAYKKKTNYLRLRAAAYPSIEDQLDMIYNEGIDKWRDSIKSIKDQYPKKEGEISIKPIDEINSKMKNVEDSLAQLAKGLTIAQSNSQDVKSVVNEVNSAMSAIKGFMMIMPDLQKTLLEIKELIQNNNEALK